MELESWPPGHDDTDDMARVQVMPATPDSVTEETPQSIAAYFTAISAQRRSTQEKFKPTLQALQSIVNLLHEGGIQQVGVELADNDTLKQLGLQRKVTDDEKMLEDAVFSILSIYDTKFIIRVKPDLEIDLYENNVNKAFGEPRSLNAGEFWTKRYSSSEKLDNFFKYNLTDKEDRLAFITTIANAAASLLAVAELKQHDAPVRRGMMLKK